MSTQQKRVVRARAISGIAGAAVVALGIVGATGLPAAAAPDDVSEGLGQFLGGSVAGIDLDGIVELAGAYAGSPSTDPDLDVSAPLSAVVLEALEVELGTLELDLLGDVITLGAVEQRAIAEEGGDAYAGSGAVTDDGAIAINPPGEGDPDFANASVDLGALLGEIDGADELIAELFLEVGALAATAEEVGGVVDSDYLIADLGFEVETPIVGDLVEALNGLIDGIEGTIEDTLSDVALDIDLNGLATISGSVALDLPSVTTIIATPVSADGVTIDLAGGTVSVDLVELLASEGVDLNSLPANTELTDYLPEILAAILGTVDEIVADLVTGLTTALGTSGLSGSFDIELLGGLAGIELTVGGTFVDPDVTATGTGTLALLDPLLDFLGLTIDGVGDLVAGLLDTASTGVLSALGATIDEAAEGLLAEVEGVVEELLDIVTQLVTLTVNVQPTAAPVGAVTGDLPLGSDGDPSFTVRALSIGLLPGIPALATTVDLASATVRSVVADPEGPGGPGAEPALPDTGYEAAGLVGLAGLMLAAGAVLLVTRRRGVRL